MHTYHDTNTLYMVHAYPFRGRGVMHIPYTVTYVRTSYLLSTREGPTGAQLPLGLSSFSRLGRVASRRRLFP
jgi:hypothetical protein